MTIQDALKLHPDAEVLLPLLFEERARVRRDRAWFFAHTEYVLTKYQEPNFKKLITKRRADWPAAYITGHKEFFGLDFLVNRNVLIPRPETELLVELALQGISNPESRIANVIDIGTGSGNIIISLAKQSPSPLARGNAPKGQRGQAKFFATDSSAKALAVARVNTRRHGMAKKIKFLRGNLLSPFLQATNYKLIPNLILANLPYGWKEWKNNTSAETSGLRFEPQQALFTKEGGLYLIRKLFEQIKIICHSGLDPESIQKNLDSRFRGNDITILLEFDPRQKSALTKLAKKYFPAAKLTFHRDLARRWRVMKITI